MFIFKKAKLHFNNLISDELIKILIKDIEKTQTDQEKKEQEMRKEIARVRAELEEVKKQLAELKSGKKPDSILGVNFPV